MTVSLPLVGGAVAVRWLGAASWTSSVEPLRWAGLAVMPVATWLAAGALDVLAPIWMAAVAAAIVVGVAASPCDDRWIYAGDAGLALAAALTTVPSVPLVIGALAAAGITAAWGLLDRIVDVSGLVGRGVAVVAVGIVALVCAELLDRASAENLYSIPEVAPGLAFLPTCGGREIEIGPGSVAWLDRPRGTRPHPTALFLHGADPRGARQPVACMVRRALLDRGYAVLALDHVGYGASAHPDSGAAPEAWDPVEPARAALEWVRESGDLTVGPVVGHSMGAVDAVRLVAAGPDGVGRAILIAAAVGGGEQDEDYWYGRFHRDRGIEYRMPRETWREIDRRFYTAVPALEGLDAGHPPVLFVEVEREWEHLLDGRREFYRRLPGEKARVRLDGASHYLNTFFHRDVMVTDAQVLRGLAEVLPAAP